MSEETDLTGVSVEEMDRLQETPRVLFEQSPTQKLRGFPTSYLLKPRHAKLDRKTLFGAGDECACVSCRLGIIDESHTFKS